MLNPAEEEGWQWTAGWLDKQILHFWGARFASIKFDSKATFFIHANLHF
jgi:hypothetical protein